MPEDSKVYALPFILQSATPIPQEKRPSEEQRYDYSLQIWINKYTGKPIVLELSERSLSSRFGESPVTAMREGSDPATISHALTSDFGETSLTKTMEGHDQSEITELSSKFGETTLSETREGADQSEILQ